MKLILASTMLPLLAWGQGSFEVYVPNGLENVEGNAVADEPFWGRTSSMRYQQVFSASEFPMLMNGGGVINGISFRANGMEDENQYVELQRFQASFSTTSKSPDSLSPVFAENVGLDNAIFFDEEDIILLSAVDFTKDIQGFSLAFSTDFYYDPREGNLLLDMKNFFPPGLEGTMRMDGQNTVGDSISSIVAYDVNSPTADQISSLGFVVRFVVTPVPEPGTWALLTLGAGIMLYANRKPGRK